MEAVQWIISAGFNIFEAIQLNEDLSRLRASLPRAGNLIERAEGGRLKNKDLAVLLLQLKDATYDAEDLLRQFDDQELRHKIEDADRGRAGQLISNTLRVAKDLLVGSKSRIKETQSKLHQAVADIEGVLGPLDLNVAPVQLMPETTSLLDDPEVFGRDQERDELIEMLGVTIGSENEQDEVPMRLGVPLTRDGPSSASARGKRVVVDSSDASTSGGRKRLKGQSSRVKPAAETNDNSAGFVSVLAIVGIGGVGKTTLAQFIYNDTKVIAHFDVRIWVCVSDHFDKRRTTREIIESITGKEFSSASSLNVLQEELKKQLMRKRFLLVLDDTWPNANDGWESFFAPLRQGLEGSMVLVTTRTQQVARRVNAIKHIHLKGLPKGIFWEFFKKCAFGVAQPELYHLLQEIGQSIADRLCGSPLAAKTLGRLLNMEMTVEHWTRIQKSELWELQHGEHDILPALQLSYLYLPQWLKICFAFCSMFPKDYSFERDEIVGIWVAQGFVAPKGSARLEDIGSSYLDEMTSRFLFQTEPNSKGQSRYVMHDLIHDMAQSVSLDECILMQDARNPQSHRPIPHTVRHISIEVNNESLILASLNNVNKLHSIRFGPKIQFEIPWFKQLSNILFLSLKGCKQVNLPEGICELNSLRCVDISQSRIKELPEKFWRLYNLQFFYAARSSLQKIHPDIVKLINLRSLDLPIKASQELPMISGLGKLSSLRNLSCFVVGKEDGRRISELKCMNQLSGKLSIKSLRNVESHEEAAEATLVDKQYLKELVLHWRDRGDSTLASQENEVLEALRPPPGIEILEVQGFGGHISPSWLKLENLPDLRILRLYGCPHLTNVPIHCPYLKQLVLHLIGVEVLTACAEGSPSGSTYPPLARLTNLRLSGCRKLRNVDQFLSPEYLQSLKSIQLYDCTSLVSLPVHEFKGFVDLTNLRLISCDKLRDVDNFLCPEYLPSIRSIEVDNCEGLVSMPVDKFMGFIHLQDLQLCNLPKLSCPREMVLPPSLRRLSIASCPGLDASLPSCLENLTSLSTLDLACCNSMKSIPLSSMHIQCLMLGFCSELSSIGGSDALSHIRYVNIYGCLELREVEQPFLKNELRKEELDELARFVRRFNLETKVNFVPFLPSLWWRQRLGEAKLLIFPSSSKADRP